jgi:flagellin
MRNANDGISAIRIVDSALGTISGVLTRMAELSEQAANGVYSNQQRSALQGEFTALGSEIGRIASTTSFNDLNLLSNSNVIVFQIGLEAASTSRVSYEGIQGTLESLTLGSGQEVSYSLLGNSSEEAQYAARTALVAVTAAIEEVASRRGSVGAVESRLEVAIGNLRQARENFSQAESRIRDADIATESAELARLQILQQAGAAVALQANQQPALALRLLNS